MSPPSSIHSPGDLTGTRLHRIHRHTQSVARPYHIPSSPTGLRHLGQPTPYVKIPPKTTDASNALMMSGRRICTTIFFPFLKTHRGIFPAPTFSSYPPHGPAPALTLTPHRTHTGYIRPVRTSRIIHPSIHPWAKNHYHYEL